MRMSPNSHKFMLTAHVLSSIGWFGALLVFLAHTVASLASGDPQIVRGVCITMGLTAWFVILPLSMASLLTGVIQALGTAWGLVRHYWVLAKLLLTVFATAILLLKLAPISELATAAAESSFSSASLAELKLSLLVHSAGGIIVLLMVTILAVFKPAGPTPFATRATARAESTPAASASIPRWVRLSLIIATGLSLILGLLVLHGGHGPSMHMLHGSGS